MPEEIKEDVKLAVDTADAVEGIATSQLGIGPVPTLSEINSWTSVYGRLKDKVNTFYLCKGRCTYDVCPDRGEGISQFLTKGGEVA